MSFQNAHVDGETEHRAALLAESHKQDNDEVTAHLNYKLRLTIQLSEPPAELPHSRMSHLPLPAWHSGNIGHG